MDAISQTNKESEMEKGDRVYIKEGYGYTSYQNGTERFNRALTQKFGVIVEFMPKQQVKVLLDVSNGWAVVTGINCIEKITK
jgi:hypothetical protein